MMKCYPNVTFSDHALRQIESREELELSDIAMALRNPERVYPARKGRLMCDHAVSDRLCLRVVFVERESALGIMAHVVTAYHMNRDRAERQANHANPESA